MLTDAERSISIDLRERGQQQAIWTAAALNGAGLAAVTAYASDVSTASNTLIFLTPCILMLLSGMALGAVSMFLCDRYRKIEIKLYKIIDRLDASERDRSAHWDRYFAFSPDQPMLATALGSETAADAEIRLMWKRLKSDRGLTEKRFNRDHQELTEWRSESLPRAEKLWTRTWLCCFSAYGMFAFAMLYVLARAWMKLPFS